MSKEEIFGELYKLALEKSSISEQIEDQINELKTVTTPMGEKTFWKEVAKLNKYIKKFNGYTDRNKYECGAKDYIRLKAVDNQLMIAVSFVVTYEVMVAALYKPLFDVVDDQGDDGFGDVLDSFPLFGEERYNMALQGEIEGETAEQYQGENYIRMNLTNGLIIFARDFKEEVEKEGEQ
jgi:hypothetical protein